MYNYKKILGFITFLIFSHQILAYDDVQYFLQEKISSPQVRWDNIVGKQPYWLSNFRAKSNNFIIMPKGEEIRVRLDRDSILRIHSDNYPLDSNMFDVQVSNGTGLYIHRKLLKNKDSNDLLLITENNAAVARVSLKSNVKEDIKLTFLASRYEPITKLAFYPDKQHVKSTTSRLMQVGYFAPKTVDFQSYNHILPGQSVEFNIEGPKRLEVSSRYIYDIKDQGETLPYNIRVHLDGKFYKEAAFIANPDHHHLYLNNQFLSKISSYYLDIPKGNHEAQISADGPVFAQFHLLESTGYLFPEVNGKPLASNELSNGTGSKLKPSLVGENMLIAQDNEWKASGLKVANVADDLWRARRDDQTLRESRDNIFDAYSFFRDLLPADLKISKSLSMDWVINYHLNNTKSDDKPYKFIDTQTDYLLKQLIFGYFVETTPNVGLKLSYNLPKLKADSDLRVIIQQNGFNSPQDLYIQYDNKLPEHIVLYPSKDLPNSAYALNSGLAALSILEKDENYKQPRFGTMGGAFSQNHIPGELYNAGILTLPLPKKTSSVKIWQQENGTPLKVALQYRDSKKFALAPLMEKRGLENIQHTIAPSLLFVDSLRFYHNCTNTNCNLSADSFYNYLVAQKTLANNHEQNKEDIKELYNNWQDLNRFLYERYLKFTTGINEDVDESFIRPLVNKSTFTENELAFAEGLTSRKDWSDAAIAWSAIIKKGGLKSWQQAHFKRIEALVNSSEGYLAERSLKALMLNAKDRETKLLAFEKLFPLYEQRQYYYGLEGLITAYLINLGNEENHLETLSNILVKDDDEPKALDLTVLLRNTRPSDEVIFTSLKNNEARIGKHQESLSDKHFWLAQELQKRGQFSQALKEFKLAGEKGKLWEKHLTQALSLKKQLRDASITKRNEAISEWLNWYYTHPGPKTWDTANHLVTNFYEAVTLYSDIRDSYGIAFITGAVKPLTLKATGPAKLSIRMRPLLTSVKYLLKNSSWAAVRIDGVSHPVKIDNYPNQKVVSIIGRENLTPGIEQSYEFEIAQGEHEINIQSNGAELLIEPFIYNPLFALSALPPVTPKTYNFVKNYYWRIQNEMFPKDTISYELVNTTPYEDGYSKKLSTEKIRMPWIPIDYRHKYDNNASLEAVEVSNLSAVNSYTPLPENSQYPITEHLSKILQQYEKTLDKSLLVKGKKFCYDHPNDYSVNQLCNYFDLSARWHQILAVDSNPPIFLKENNNEWNPEDTKLALRKTLINEDLDNDYVVSDTSVSVMQFINSAPINVKIKVFLLKLITENPGDATIGYQIDEDKIETIHIQNADKIIENEIAIKEGKHSLRIFLVDPRQETFVGVKLHERKIGETNWQEVEVKKKRKYFVATDEAPIKHKVKAPAWIQVHKLSADGRKDSEDFFVLTGEQDIVLKNDKNAEATYYRLFEKIPENPMIADYQAQPVVNYIRMKEAPLLLEPKEVKQTDYRIRDDLPLAGQSDGTWSLSNFYISENSMDTVNGAITPNDKNLSDQSERGVLKFMEQSVKYRYFDEINRNYIQTNLIAREFNKSRPSFGLQARIDHEPVSLPVSLFADGKTYLQRFNNRNNYSMYGEIGIRNNLVWSRQLNQTIDLSAFGRVVNYKAAPNLDSKYPDPDVYSKYNKDHLKGINTSYILNFSPLLDTRLRAGGSLKTASHLNKIDQAGFIVGADQLVTPLTMGIDYNQKKYFKGGARLYSFNRHKIGVYVNWEQWLATNNYRVELDLSLAKVYDTNVPKRPLARIQPKPLKDWVGKIGATIHLGNGRGYRDFRSEEIRFKKIKERSIPVRNEIRGNEL